MTHEVALLPELYALREELEQRLCLPNEAMKVFATSLSSTADAGLLLKTIQSGPTPTVESALSAAYFHGALLGLGTYAECWCAREYSPALFSAVISAASILRDCAIIWREPSALKCLLAFEEWERGIGLLEDVQQIVRAVVSTLGFSDPIAVQLDPGDAERVLLRRLLDGDRDMDRSRAVWFAKNFASSPEVASALAQLLDVPRVRFNAAFVLTCFFGADVDLMGLLSRYREFDRRHLPMARILNMVAIQAMRRRDSSLLRLIPRLGNRSYDASTLAAFSRWCEKRMAAV